MKIRLQIPGKIVLFGEWAVLEGALGIATAVDSYCTSDISTADDFAWETPLQSYGPDSRNDDSFLAKLVQLLKTDRNFLPAIHCQSKFEWDLNFGLGSSSALILTALGLADAKLLSQENIKPLWIKSRQWQRALQSGRASGIDLAAQIAGGSVVVSRDRFDALELQIPSEILFFHSGKKHSTAAAMKDPPDASTLRKIAISTERFLKEGPHGRDWPRAIAEHWEAMRDAGRVDPILMQFHRALVDRGLKTALKACGAGGSESILLHSAESEHAQVREVAQGLGLISKRYRPSKSGIRLL